jgi:hypothetical protein
MIARSQVPRRATTMDRAEIDRLCRPLGERSAQRGIEPAQVEAISDNIGSLRHVSVGCQCLGWLLNRLAHHAELVKHFREDTGDLRRLAAFDLAAVQHVDRLAVLEQGHGG